MGKDTISSRGQFLTLPNQEEKILHYVSDSYNVNKLAIESRASCIKHVLTKSLYNVMQSDQNSFFLRRRRLAVNTYIKKCST